MSCIGFWIYLRSLSHVYRLREDVSCVMEAHRKLRRSDKRVQDNLVLYSGRAWFADFFQNYVEKVKRDSWAEHRAEISSASGRRKLIRITQTVESTSDAIGMTDMSGRSIYHNHAFINLYGYTLMS